MNAISVFASPLLAVASCCAVSAHASAYVFEEDFKVKDERNRAYGIDVEENTSYAHGHGRVADGKYEIKPSFESPDIEVTAVCGFYRPGGELSFDFSSYSYVVDAIDDIPAKVELWVRCRESGVPLISAMGAGNKLDPSLFRVADLAKTEGCPLAKIMRKKLKERGIAHGKVVFSPELPVKTGVSEPGSLSFVPPVAGYVIAGEVVRDLLSL